MSSAKNIVDVVYALSSSYENVYEPIYETSYSISFVFMEEEESPEPSNMYYDNETGATIH